PGLLGFPMPDADMVRHSTAGATLSENTYAIWSAWLLGVVFVYGLLVRALSLFLCLWQLRGALRGLALDISLPSYSRLVTRLVPTSEGLGIDAPAGEDVAAQRQDNSTLPFSSDPVYVGIELPPGATWPVFSAAPDTQDGGLLETREQRHALLDRL